MHSLLPGNPLPGQAQSEAAQHPPARPLARGAKRLFEEFAAHLKQRMNGSRGYLLSLYHFFPQQHERGLYFTEFPADLIDDYLQPRTAHARRAFLNALIAWLRFLYARKELLLPLHGGDGAAAPRSQSPGAAKSRPGAAGAGAAAPG